MIYFECIYCHGMQERTEVLGALELNQTAAEMFGVNVS